MNGVINVFKNKGMSSFDVVRKIKKFCSWKKGWTYWNVDPEATGVLPVCLERQQK